ncbi:MAG TPA: peptide-methionine (S)-S-oxide reductase MsrA [Trueperaceae bacterium]|nr:peptide-methionine (S)-S-oxide reductase MsrA [Trueperaceae bacterium]
MERLETAILAGGCFWCLEAVYQELDGVVEVKSGYAGGHVPNPTYEQVCSGTTGHAEVVRVTYDPSVITYDDLLDVFFTIHDPTTLNRQGNDVGEQYRSAVFTLSEEQDRKAREAMRRVEEQGLYDAPLVTRVEPAGEFYPAEAYHDDYFARNPYQPYCAAVIAPKVAKFRKQHLNRLRRDAPPTAPPA